MRIKSRMLYIMCSFSPRHIATLCSTRRSNAMLNSKQWKFGCFRQIYKVQHPWNECPGPFPETRTKYDEDNCGGGMQVVRSLRNRHGGMTRIRWWCRRLRARRHPGTCFCDRAQRRQWHPRKSTLLRFGRQKGHRRIRVGDTGDGDVLVADNVDCDRVNESDIDITYNADTATARRCLLHCDTKDDTSVAGFHNKDDRRCECLRLKPWTLALRQGKLTPELKTKCPVAQVMTVLIHVRKYLMIFTTTSDNGSHRNLKADHRSAADDLSRHIE